MRLWGAAISALVFACGPTAPPVTNAGDSVRMQPDEAARLVSDAERELAASSPVGRLDTPADLDAVLQTLQSDRIDLFPAAIAKADAEGGIEGQALAAQLELSWGEGQRIVADVLSRAADQVEQGLRETSSDRGIGARRQQLARDERRARDAIDASRRLSEALGIVSETHIEAGATRTRALLDANPDHYLAYRLAADYYRLREEWERFDLSVEELASRRPDSTGLKFLRGASLVRRQRNEDEAERHLRAALEDDPQFTRAQVFVLAVQDTLPEIHDELEALKQLSPHHQLVVWAGPLLERGYLPFTEE